MTANPLSSAEFLQRTHPLHDAEMFLPMDFLQSSVLPAIATTAVALAVVYKVSFIVAEWALKKDVETSAKRKLAYQLTNLFANSYLGILGLYYEYWQMPAEVKLEDTVGGLEHFYVLSSVQLGYQLWAIPIGFFHVNESPAMLIHHFAVIFAASMSGFLTNGFRYWTSFFYGILEISSVPLGIMNIFKDNPGWSARYPGVFTAVRLVFAFSYLSIRIVMFLPRKVQFLREHMLFFTSSDILPYQVYMSEYRCS